MENIKVSIIVPVYKVPEKNLHACIESIIAQTLNEIEIIIVDDGSPDDCGKICEDYKKSDDRINVIHKVNGGLSAARNTGFLAACGEYIMFVDGDDWIDREMCAAMYNTSKEKNVQLVMCGICREYGSKSDVYKYSLKEGKVYSGSKCKRLQEEILHYNSNIATAYAKLIKKSILDKYNILHDEELRQGAEGMEFNIRLFERLESVAFIAKPFYHYNYNDNSISSSHDEKNHLYVIRCFEKIDKLIEKSGNKDNMRFWLYNRMLYVIVTTAISGYFNPANSEPYREKKRKYKEYLKNPLIQKSLAQGNTVELSLKRKFVLFLIKHELFFAVNILGHIRKWQKLHK